MRAEEPGDPVKRLNLVAEQLPERDDQQVPDSVPAELAAAREPVLNYLAPGSPPGVVAAERRERHPQVTRREDAVLAAQPAARATVVGDRDDRGQVAGDTAHRGQAGVQTVAAAESHDPAAGRPDRVTHARDRDARPERPATGRPAWTRVPRRSPRFGVFRQCNRPPGS